MDETLGDQSNKNTRQHHHQHVPWDIHESSVIFQEGGDVRAIPQERLALMQGNGHVAVSTYAT
jgi:hypothetical protein